MFISNSYIKHLYQSFKCIEHTVKVEINKRYTDFFLLLKQCNQFASNNNS